MLAWHSSVDVLISSPSSSALEYPSSGYCLNVWWVITGIPQLISSSHLYRHLRSNTHHQGTTRICDRLSLAFISWFPHLISLFICAWIPSIRVPLEYMMDYHWHSSVDVLISSPPSSALKYPALGYRSNVQLMISGISCDRISPLEYHVNALWLDSGKYLAHLIAPPQQLSCTI